MQDYHEVSVKVALYAADASSVLVMLYSKPLIQNNTFGLPGGHIENGEDPDRALERELMEELGIAVTDFSRAGFYTKGNKIILAYTGVVPRDMQMTPSCPEFEIGVWTTKKELEVLDIDAGHKSFVLKNWPATYITQ